MNKLSSATSIMPKKLRILFWGVEIFQTLFVIWIVLFESCLVRSLWSEDHWKALNAVYYFNYIFFIIYFLGKIFFLLSKRLKISTRHFGYFITSSIVLFVVVLLGCNLFSFNIWGDQPAFKWITLLCFFGLDIILYTIFDFFLPAKAPREKKLEIFKEKTISRLSNDEIHKKQKFITLVVSIFFGILGIHRFINQKYISGLLQFFSTSICFIIALCVINQPVVTIIFLMIPPIWCIIDIIAISLSYWDFTKFVFNK